jgi:hypothetical protein
MIPVSDIRPKSTLPRRSHQASIQHFHRRVIGAYYFRTQYELLQPHIQRIEQFGRLPHPATHRLVGDLHAEPLEDLRLPMHRHMIGYLANDHLRQ